MKEFYPFFVDYIPLIISNVIVIAFFLFFQKNTKKVKTSYKSKIAELESRSLRAQMNPHFIFNAINGVQSIMLLKGEVESNRYIGLLSKILRFTLEINRQELISLEEEIDYLEAYIGLQQMRLDNKIDYKIHLDLLQHPKHYITPPMLIQPIVENAIIHGLTPLKKGGFLTINIQEDTHSLIVTVVDNGIGLKASKKMNNSYNTTHKSYATQILRERIEIFNNSKKGKMEFRIEDLTTKKKSGTKAMIKIPKQIQL